LGFVFLVLGSRFSVLGSGSGSRFWFSRFRFWFLVGSSFCVAVVDWNQRPQTETKNQNHKPEPKTGTKNRKHKTQKQKT